MSANLLRIFGWPLPLYPPHTISLPLPQCVLNYSFSISIEEKSTDIICWILCHFPHGMHAVLTHYQNESEQEVTVANQD
eukprot:scaffold168146_cov69-Attheya_sp.AAC.1